MISDTFFNAKVPWSLCLGLCFLGLLHLCVRAAPRVSSWHGYSDCILYWQSLMSLCCAHLWVPDIQRMQKELQELKKRRIIRWRITRFLIYSSYFPVRLTWYICSAVKLGGNFSFLSRRPSLILDITLLVFTRCKLELSLNRVYRDQLMEQPS